MTEKKEKEAPKKKEEVDVDAFISRKLKSINEMGDTATARFLAQRVLDNRRGKK